MRKILGRRREALRGKDEGFTLIELMVVVLIIAILIAIAIPTFLGARQRAQNRAAQSDLRNSFTAAKTMYVDQESYLDTDIATTVATLNGIEPSLTHVDASAAAPAGQNVGLVVATATQILLVRESTSGTWFCIRDTATGAGAGTFYASGAAFADVDTVAECAGAAW